MPIELPALTVANAAAWRQWLLREGATSKGVMLTCSKKASKGPTTLTYPQALDEALCCAWIDSGGKRIDDSTHYYRFTPRKPKGLWSKRNVGYIERLEQEGRMTEIGRAAVEAAKADGRWDAAYSGSGTVEPPADFLAALNENPSAQVTYDALNKGNRWMIYFRIISLKTAAGREKRIKAFVDMLARGETPVPQKGMKMTMPRGPQKSAITNDPTSSSAPKKPVANSRRQTRSGRAAPSYTK